ncbi:MAG: hypothetical protein LBB79_02425, partial [Prevotellaceae bacterium]|nr:hypothetical protein [Prevotellaceae bacterium]
MQKNFIALSTKALNFYRSKAGSQAPADLAKGFSDALPAKKCAAKHFLQCFAAHVHLPFTLALLVAGVLRRNARIYTTSGRDGEAVVLALNV